MHISHDFIATKICPELEFLVVFGQVRVWDRKSAGWVGMVCGAGAGKISQIPAGAGRERTKNFNSCRTPVDTNWGMKNFRWLSGQEGSYGVMKIMEKFDDFPAWKGLEFFLFC